MSGHIIIYSTLMSANTNYLHAFMFICSLYDRAFPGTYISAASALSV